MLNVGVIGATGYTGEEIVKILVRHKSVKITVLQAVVEEEKPISEIFPALAGKIDTVCEKPDLKKALNSADLFFLALPHKVSMTVAPALLKKGKKVIDLSADYRLGPAEYEKWYGIEHRDKANIEEAVYGLPEFFRDKIKKARLIANPGCYPTATILAAAPVIKGVVPDGVIIVDAKSGITGAGRNAVLDINENVKQYKIYSHQHMPEMIKILSGISSKKTKLIFAPSVIPIKRGILSTLYIPLDSSGLGLDESNILEKYKKEYENEPFVRIYDSGKIPEIKNVANTNYCDIGIKMAGKFLVVVSCIDNLLKGAAGQAVQNMNIMYGFEETEALA